jgi:hypothetical protein
VSKREASNTARSPDRAKRRFADVVTGAAGLASLLIVYAGFRHFGTALLRQPLFFAVLLAVAALAASYRWRISYRVNLALLLLSCGVALWAVELVLAFMPAFTGEDPVVKRFEDMVRQGLAVDSRSQSEVVTDLRRRVDAYPAMTGEVLRGGERHGLSLAVRVAGHRVVPLSNVANRRIVDCNESGQWSSFETDAYGFRNPPALWNSPALEVALVGDSFVSGSCVGDGEDMASGVRRQAPATVNVAVGGFGPLMALGALEEYVAPHRPKIVVWFYYEGNDLQDLLMELRDSTLRKYLEDPAFTQRLIAHQDEIDGQMRTFLDSLLRMANRTTAATPERVALVDWLKMTIKLYRVRTTMGLADWGAGCCDVGLFGQVLAHADSTVRGWGGRLHFVYLPSWRGLARPPWLRGEAALRARNDVLRTVRQQAIPLLDAHSLFRDKPGYKAWFAGPDLHFNAAGYERVARALADSLSPVLAGLR